MTSAPADKADKADTVASHGGAAGFDFWLGDWDCTFAGGVATNRITKILGQVVHEEFHSTTLNGESWSAFNAPKQVWLQTWVDDQGAYLLFAGRREPERMILIGRRPDGTPTGTRMVWEDITGDAFTWDYQREDPGGWSSQWRIAYRRRI
jgi:hypothetical protein